MPTIILEKQKTTDYSELLKSFERCLEKTKSFKRSEIEELTIIQAKNPVDKLIISELPTDVVMQGDLLIWSELTDKYKENIQKVTDLQETTKMALQEDDSITGDHELVTLKNAKFTLKTGKFVPSILKEHLWGNNRYDCKVLEIDTPFVIKHREHGNMTLTAGKYMICSSLDSETLTRMRD